jgi:putative alpha-1,2-mannosidase
MKTLTLIAVLLLTAYCSLITAQTTADYTRYVNPFIGTGGHGHTFPGAVLPFGMVQLSPDTRTDNWDGSSGYHYSDDVIYGFSHTHLSGTGIPDGCDILFMPELDGPMLYRWPGEGSPEGTGSKFSHANEKAEPGYYSVMLDDGIRAELTATNRVGFHRYTFPKREGPPNVNITLNLKWRDKVLDAQIKVIGAQRIEGFRRSSSWAKDQTVYFVAEFSKPFKEVYAFTNQDPQERENLKKVKRGLLFDSPDGTQVLIKVAISYVSIEGARKNLAAELPGWDFDKVRADARAAWNKELSKIEVSGGTPDQMTTFYTALYHTMIHPSIFNDVDGNYRGLDGKIHNIADGASTSQSTETETPSMQKPARKQGRNTQSHRSSNGQRASDSKVDSFALPNGRASAPSDQYTVFSLWDTFRAAHPLYTIIDQKRTVDFINTFIRQYEQGGRLPVWELWGNETDTMIGYHAVSVIADAMAKGIKGFDYEKAYEAAKHSAELDHYGLAAYKKRGYISMEDENESVSKTLEYAYDDWCIAQIARAAAVQKYQEPRLTGVGWRIDYDAIRGLESESLKYNRRARYFENLFDSETGFFRPRKNGGFLKPFAPNEVTFNYTEGNAWQYSFFAPQDISRLMELMGGKEKFAAKLDELFTTETKLAGREQPDITGLIGQYAHGNEPSHHIAYLYMYADQPSKTQARVRHILDEFYKPTPDGLIGNEDCGQMSAWYVLSASGFYPVSPGNAIYTFGTPLFPEVKFHLENRKTFIVRAKNVSTKNFYIKSATLDGAPYEYAFISQDKIMAGGVLEFEMSDTPVKHAFSTMPATQISGDFPTTPVIESDSRTFTGKTTVTIKSAPENARIFYTADGREPTVRSPRYISPFTIEDSSTIKAIAVFFIRNRISGSSGVAEAHFYKKPNDWTVQIFSKYNRQYTGGGDEGLIDGIRGTVSFASGEWQGYQGQDFVAVVDLQRSTEIHELGGGFLQNARSWIWMPTRIEFELSDDNQTWHKAAEIKTDVAPDDMDPVIRDYTQTIAPTKARYVRITARNFGKIPSWHPGSGGDAFIFVDEILVR